MVQTHRTYKINLDQDDAKDALERFIEERDQLYANYCEEERRYWLELTHIYVLNWPGEEKKRNHLEFRFRKHPAVRCRLSPHGSLMLDGGSIYEDYDIIRGLCAILSHYGINPSPISLMKFNPGDREKAIVAEKLFNALLDGKLCSPNANDTSQELQRIKRELAHSLPHRVSDDVIMDVLKKVMYAVMNAAEVLSGSNPTRESNGTIKVEIDSLEHKRLEAEHMIRTIFLNVLERGGG